MYCRNCGTQINETMPCPNCGWQKVPVRPIQPVMNQGNIQQTQQNYTNSEPDNNRTQYIPDNAAINNQPHYTPNNNETVKQAQIKQPVKHQLTDIYHDIKSSRSVNNFVLRMKHLRESGNIPQLFIYLLGILVKLISYVLFTISFSNLINSLTDLIASLFFSNSKLLIFLMVLSFILRYLSKFMGGSAQFRETESYKKYNPLVCKILKTLEFIVFAWCAIDFVSALISFATGYSAYSYFTSLF